MKWKISSIGVDLNESMSVGSNLQRESRENIFEIIPKYLIESEDNSSGAGDGQIKKGKKIKYAAASGGSGGTEMTALSIENEIVILSKNESESEVFRKTFEAPIDFIVWRRSVLLLGLSSSEILLIDPRNFTIYESRKVFKGNDVKERFFVDAFIHSNPDPKKIDMVAVGVDGDVYSFLNISLSDGSLDFTHDENVSLDIDTTSIKGTVKKYLSENSKVLSAASPSRNSLILAEENGRISIFQMQNDNEDDENLILGEYPIFTFSDNLVLSIGLLPSQVLITKVVHFEGLLFALLSSGRLEILLDQELFSTGSLSLPKNCDFIHDFTIVLTVSGVKIWTIFSNRVEDDNYIGVYSGNFKKNPGFVYKIPAQNIQDSTKSREFKFPNQATIFDEPNFIVEQGSFTKIYEMKESSTEATLDKLLTKGFFQKAENLAKQYGKDLDLVNKSKVKAKSKEYMVQKYPQKSEMIIKEMFNILEVINDAKFVCTFTANFQFFGEVSKIAFVKQMIATGLKRVNECSQSQEAKKILLVRKKLVTFDQVLPGAGVQEWNEFNSENNTMISQAKWFLEKNQFDKCEKVWRRHCDEFQEELSLIEIGTFFWTLFSEQLNSSEAISLFKTILPLAIDKTLADIESSGNNNKIDILIEIVAREVRSLERELDWPIGAVNFTSTLIKLIRDEEKAFSNLPKKDPKNMTKANICARVAEKIEIIHQALLELKELKASHSIRINFESYTQDEVLQVVSAMLNKLFVKEEIERFVRKFLEPFAKRKNLNLDKLFYEHIKNTVADVPFFVNSDIPFEERLVCLIDFIKSTQVKFESVLKMSQEWPVPWSFMMSSLVDNILSLKTFTGEEENLKKTIHLMKIQVPFRCILNKYRLKASRLKSELSIKLALKRMFKQRQPEFYEDCLELVKHTGKLDRMDVDLNRFFYELMETDILTDDILRFDYSNHILLGKMLNLILFEFKNGKKSNYDAKIWERLTECGKRIANKLEDKKTIQYFKLKDFIPDLWNIDIVNSPMYPFNILDYVLKDRNISALDVIIYCRKISKITFFYFNDLLITGAYILLTELKPTDAITKLWVIINYLVNSPNNRFNSELLDLTLNASFSIAQILILQSSTTSSINLKNLHHFLIMLSNSFSKNLSMLSTFFFALRMFTDLRDKEVPLETEFLDIYKFVWCNQMVNFDKEIEKMKVFGETLIRFGEKDILAEIFNTVFLEFNSRGAQNSKFLEIAQKVKDEHSLLMRESVRYEIDEDDRDILELVEALNSLNINVNSYSLRHRNKGKLLNKLISLEKYILASEVALVFDYKEREAWSNILLGLCDKGTIEELKKVLERLQKIIELWTLPEFASSWLKVAEVDPPFKDLFPLSFD